MSGRTLSLGPGCPSTPAFVLYALQAQPLTLGIREAGQGPRSALRRLSPLTNQKSSEQKVCRSQGAKFKTECDCFLGVSPSPAISSTLVIHLPGVKGE